MNRKLAVILAAITGFTAMAGSQLSAAEPETYTFGVVPQFDARQTHRVWRPLLTELEKQTGFKFRLVGSPDIPGFEDQFMAGDFDFAYMNPYQVYKAIKTQKYIPLVRDVGSTLFGLLVVRKDSAVQKVEDLAGKRVAFPAPNALGASLVIRADLKNIYGIDVEPVYVQSHSSVYLGVAMAEVAAGGGVQKTLAQQPAQVGDKLRIIYKTREITPHPVAAHYRVPVAVRESVRNALLELGNSDEGRALLRPVPVKAIGAASIDDYLPLGEWGLDAFYAEQ